VKSSNKVSFCRIDNCYKTKDGAYCIIPFIYKGKTYYECTRKDGGPMWCATTSNFDVDDQGGECEGKITSLFICWFIFSATFILSRNMVS
jgi:hypothetical protein